MGKIVCYPGVAKTSSNIIIVDAAAVMVDNEHSYSNTITHSSYSDALGSTLTIFWL